MRNLLVFLFSLFSFLCYSQDYSWWEEKHNYDGVRPWSSYMIFSSGYMGPNALPVPDSKDGLLPSYPHLEIAYENHFSEGDFTRDLFTELYFPLFSKRAGLNVSYVPVEHYEMDSTTRDLRRARDYDGTGISAGDFYVSTYIQFLKDMDKLPDVLVTVNIKTASGTNLEAARNTDAPGYFFDCSMGKDFKFENGILKSIRPHGMLGFYAWQTNRGDFFQNDAVVYGAGLNFHFSKFELNNSIDGYSGYINNGDKPVVFRSTFKSKFKSVLNCKIMFQHGIRDFPYNTVRAGFELDFNKIVKSLKTK